MNTTAQGDTYQVPATEPGARLDRLLADALPQFSRSRIKVLIQAGHVAAGEATITEPSYRVKPGQNFAIFVPHAAPAIPKGEAIALDVVYEDEYLLVIDKPAGLVVHPAAGNQTGTLVNALIAHCGDSLSGIGGVRRPGIVHRLDKDTSGLMVVAKTDGAHASLSEQFSSRSIQRAYAALVWGVPRGGRDRIKGNIGRSPRNRKKMAVLEKGGRPATTRYELTMRFGTAASMLDCRLETGRTHQIRVHLAHLGHPVMADPAYGGGVSEARRRAAGPDVLAAVKWLGRQALHAKLLGFQHPAGSESLQFESNLPADIKDLMNCLERI